MLLSITTTHQPATDLGFLLHKHPDRFQSVNLAIGNAHIFYPESSEKQTTACLLLDIDPIDLVRGRHNISGKGFSLEQYVNDRPYVASSFLSVAIAKAFSTAMNGTCKNRPELVDLELPLTVKLAVVSAPKGGEALIRSLFEPLGYKVSLQRHVLDEAFDSWGHSKYFTLVLSHVLPLKNLLSHLYVLIPALDNDKHYYVSQEEIEKLLQKGKGWLETHPQKELITRRYLINLRGLARKALQRLQIDEISESTAQTKPDPKLSVKKNSLHNQRLEQAVEQLKSCGAQTVLDLGCGEGKLLKLLLKEKQFTRIVGMDVSYRELLKAQESLHWDRMSEKKKERINLFQGSLTYKDKRLAGFDAATIIEVIEHLEPSRLAAFTRVVFEYAKPGTIVLTTPNAEYNVMFEGMAAGSMRHTDHRFEWTRQEFESWAMEVAQTYVYKVKFLPIGEVDKKAGAPSQMAVFSYGT